MADPGASLARQSNPKPLTRFGVVLGYRALTSTETALAYIYEQSSE